MAKDKEPVPEPDVDPADPVDPELPSQGQFMTLMSTLVDAIKNASMTPGALKDILLENTALAGEIAKKARWPEDPVSSQVSAFFSEADLATYGSLKSKPKLTRQTYFCGGLEKEEQLTPGEILAYEAIKETRSVRSGAWRAEVKHPTVYGARDSLYVWVPKDTVDQRMVLPSLHLILHELNGGPSTEDVFALLKQIESLKSMLASKGATASELEHALLAK